MRRVCIVRRFGQDCIWVWCLVSGAVCTPGSKGRKIMASALHNYEQNEDVAEIDPRREIKRFVKNVETPGTFAFGSSLRPAAPNLTVKGLGNIPLPLSKEGVDKLRGVAEVAPFGHGTEAKVDTKVQQAWQIDGALIGLSDEFTEAVGN